MTIDVKPLLRGEVKTLELDYRLPMELPGVKFEEEARVFGEITDRAGYMRLTLKLSVPFVAECARCLDEVRGVFEEDFERTVVTKGSVSEEQLDDAIELALQYSASRTIIIEEYLQGRELMAIYTLVDGKATLSCLNERYITEDHKRISGLCNLVVNPSSHYR